jgi:hypothetical protein
VLCCCCVDRVKDTCASSTQLPHGMMGAQHFGFAIAGPKDMCREMESTVPAPAMFAGIPVRYCYCTGSCSIMASGYANISLRVPNTDIIRGFSRHLSREHCCRCTVALQSLLLLLLSGSCRVCEKPARIVAFRLVTDARR